MQLFAKLDSPRTVVLDLVTVLVVIAGVSVLAAVGSSYLQGALVIFSINAVLVISYRTITTMGGWSFAHVAIMGVGGYAVAVLSKPPMDIPVAVTFALGGLAAGLVSALLAYPVLRTRQYYFFLSTFAAGEALRQCFIQFRQLTGGTSGIAFIEYPAFVQAGDTLQFLALVLAVFFLLGLFYLMFDASETGMKIRAVGLDETLSQSLGMNPWRLRALSFVLGSVGAGVAGGLLVSYNGIVAPADFSPELMFKIVAACIVGGTRRLYGPILGLTFLTIVEEAFRGVPEYVPLVWGGLVLAATLYVPNGLEGLVDRLRASLVRRRRHA